jgi:DNA-binding MarR family transcriptional regulator
VDPKRNDAPIARTAARLARHVEISLTSVDLSLAQFRVLYQLAEGTVASSSLATQIAVSPPSITNVVEGLVQRGLVKREHSDDDRRRVSLSLTTPGEQLLESAEQAVEARLIDLAGEVDDPKFTESAISGLASWRQAFVAHRITRQAEKSKRAKVAAR